MTRDDYKEFCNFMGAAAEAVGKQSPSDAALMLSFEALKKYSIEQIQGAIAAHLAGPDGRFMPTPSHIVEQIDGKPQDRAAVAWALVEREMDVAKGYESVRFPLPAYHYAIEQIGGWISLTDKYDGASVRDVQILFQKFAQFYGIAERLGISWEDVPAYLIGFYEHEKSGRPAGKKVRIAETGEFIPHDELFRRLAMPKRPALEGKLTAAAMLAEAKSCHF